MEFNRHRQDGEFLSGDPSWEEVDLFVRKKKVVPLWARLNRNWWRRPLQVGFALFGVACLFALVALADDRSAFPWWWCVGGTLVLAAGASAFQPFVIRGELHRLRERQYAACPCCGCDIQIRNNLGSCSRCESTLTTGGLAKVWERAYQRGFNARRDVDPPPAFDPQSARQGRRANIVFAVAIILATGASAVVAFRFNSGAMGTRVVFWSIFICGSLVARQFRAKQKPRWKEFASKGYRACPECLYDLSGSPASGNCPECSFVFTPQILELRWQSRGPTESKKT